MEHIIITEIDIEYIKIQPEQGYRLFNIPMNRYVSEAIIKREHLSDYRAIEIEG